MIAVPTGLGKDAAGDKHARPLEQTLFERCLMTLIRPSGVTNGGETAMQHSTQVFAGARGHFRGEDMTSIIELADIDM
jgi:hypothetical protein